MAQCSMGTAAPGVNGFAGNAGLAFVVVVGLKNAGVAGSGAWPTFSSQYT
jgi:hypothetical protein